MKTIGVDCDSVLYPTIEIFKQVALQENLFSETDFFEPQTSEPWFEWGLDKETAYNFMDTHVAALLGSGQPFPHVKETLEKLSGEYRFVLVTARLERIAGPTTINWLQQHELLNFFDQIFFTSLKHRTPIDMLIDDSPKHLQQLHDIDKPTIRFVQPWNMTCNSNYEMSCWLQLPDILKQI